MATGLPIPFHLPVTVLPDGDADIPRFLGVIDGRPMSNAVYQLPKVSANPEIRLGGFLYVRNSGAGTITLLCADGDVINGGGVTSLSVAPGKLAVLVFGAMTEQSCTWFLLLNADSGVQDSGPISGYWVNTFKGPFYNLFQLWHFYSDGAGNMRAHVYAGNANSLEGTPKFREWTPEDSVNSLYNYGTPAASPFPIGNDFALTPVDDTNTKWIMAGVSTDDPTYLTQLQNQMMISFNEDKSYLYVHWHVTPESDVPEFNLHQAIRLQKLPETPSIASYTDLFPNQLDPVRIFNEVVDCYLYNGNPQTAAEVASSDFPGWAAIVAKRDQLLTSTVKYTSTVVEDASGIWQTKPDNITGNVTYGWTALPPTTTFLTQGPNYAGLGGYVKFSGIDESSPWYVLVSSPPTENGWEVALLEGNDGRDPSTVYDADHYDTTNHKHVFAINFDSSGLDPYDPDTDGVIEVEVSFLPVTPSTDYYSLVGAVFDFTRTVGRTTHSRARCWMKATWDGSADTFDYVRTFDELKQLLLGNPWDDTIPLKVTLRSRGFGTTTGDRIYVGPDNYFYSISAGGATSPNDPTGLNLGDPNFDYNIDFTNYLDPGKTYFNYWRVTGDVDPDKPITGALTAIDPDYYFVNGSSFDFTNALVIDGNPDPTVWQLSGDFPFNVYFGIVQAAKTPGQTVAYIRFGDYVGFDSAYAISVLPEFATPGLPAGIGNYVPWLTSMISQLKTFNPTKWIVDNRANGGGISAVTSAVAAMFGGDRPGMSGAYAPADDGSEPTVSISSIGMDANLPDLVSQQLSAVALPADTIAALYPNGTVRGTTVIVLTSVSAGSGGDIFPNLMSNPDQAPVTDIGASTTCKIVGDVDGRIHGSASAPMSLYTNSGSGLYYAYMGFNVSAFEISLEQGSLIRRADSSQYWFSNQHSCTVPAYLINSDLNGTVWLDTGAAGPYPKNPSDGGVDSHVLPLSTGVEQPVLGDPTTYRDIWLEAAILQS